MMGSPRSSFCLMVLGGQQLYTYATPQPGFLVHIYPVSVPPPPS